MGVNFYDTAIAYQSGTSEQYVGRALRDFAKREEVVVADKADRQKKWGCHSQPIQSRISGFAALRVLDRLVIINLSIQQKQQEGKKRLAF